MISYHVVGAYRVEVEHPVFHSHLIAVGTVDFDANNLVPTKAWTANDLRETEPVPVFVIGPVGVTVPADVSVAPCPACGELVVRVFPRRVGEHAARVPDRLTHCHLA